MPNNTEKLNKPSDKTRAAPDQEIYALLYCRVSSKRQETEGHGLDSQEHRCKNYAVSLGHPVEKVFPDSFTGGGNFMERPAMRELLDYVDKHPTKQYVVIFDDLKRFARDTIFHWNLRSAFKARGIIPLCLNYKFDDTPEGTFVETIFAAQNQLEREQNRRQVVQKMKARLEAGYWPFGRKRGYTIVKDPVHGKLAVPNDDGLILLKPAIEGFATGKLKRKVDVCRYLVENGFWKGQVAEKYTDEITAIFRDPFYFGDIEYKPWGVSRREGHHQPIISPETFEVVQERLKNDGLNKRIRIDTSSDFEHRGLITCDTCQHHLTAAWSKGQKKKHAYYFCQTRVCEYYRKSIRRKDVKDRFDDMLKKTHLKPDIEKIVKVIFDRVWDYEVKNIGYKEIISEEQIGALKDDIRRFTAKADAAATEHIREGYEMQIGETVAKLKAVQEQPKEAKKDLSVPYRTALDKATELLKNPYSVWKKMDTHDKHELFYFIFETKLPYDQKMGYRTDKIQSYTRLFEDFVTRNSYDVDTIRNLSNEVKEYLSRFWLLYQNSSNLQKALEEV
jgi:site-specific DNA recombinase